MLHRLRWIMEPYQIAVANDPVLSGPAIERLEKSPISKVIVCNTIEMKEENKFSKPKL